MKSARGFPVHKFDTVGDTYLPLKLLCHKVFESILKFRQAKKITSLKTNEGAGAEKHEMAPRCLTVSFDLATKGVKSETIWKTEFNTLRTGSFKLFKRPFPGFLTILTL